VIKNIAKELFNQSIYPDAEEYKEVSESYFEWEHFEFYDSLSKKHWSIYYQKYLQQGVSFQIFLGFFGVL